MAIYTIKLRNLLKIPGFDIGLKVYPIYDEAHREELNKKILKHYSEYEIGLETPSLFKHYFNMAMDEIMPYYNQLYNSEKYKFDPYNAIDITEIETGMLTSSNKNQSASFSTSDGESRSEGERLFSQTPQAHVEDVKNGNYLTDATFSKNSELNTNTIDNSSNSSSDTNSNNNVTRKRSGNENTDLLGVLEKLRKSFLNIDKMIIEDPEIKSCFMPLWG